MSNQLPPLPAVPLGSWDREPPESQPFPSASRCPALCDAHTIQLKATLKKITDKQEVLGTKTKTQEGQSREMGV